MTVLTEIVAAVREWRDARDEVEAYRSLPIVGHEAAGAEARRVADAEMRLMELARKLP